MSGAELKVTIKAVAEAANVSVTSVSNYVNGRMERMSAETKARIEEVVGRLGYIPSPAARGLKLNRQFTVGVIITEPAPYFRFSPFISQIFSGLVTDLSKAGYACILQRGDDCSSSSRLLANYSRSDAMCVFLAGTRPQRKKAFDALTQLGKPIVAVQEHESLLGPDGALLRQDDAGGGYELINHLMDRGARSFVYLIPAYPWPGNQLREKGIRAALRDRRIPGDLVKVECGLGSFAEARTALAKWLSSNNRPDAVIANHDQIGIAALRALSDHRLNVPSDVLVASFSASELWEYSNPTLTNVASAAHRLGRVAAEVLLERLEKGAFSTKEMVLPVSLQLGGSTDRAVEKSA